MKLVLLTAGLFAMCFGIPGAEVPGTDVNTPVKLSQIVKDGTLRISAKNVSGRPILAYVVAVEDSGQIVTHHDFYTGRDSFGPGKSIELVFAVHSPGTPKVFVDYVRLSDRSTWGDQVTDDGKDVAAAFPN